MVRALDITALPVGVSRDFPGDVCIRVRQFQGNKSICIAIVECCVPRCAYEGLYPSTRKVQAKLSANEVFYLGNQFRDAAIKLGDWRFKNRAGLSKAQWDELDEREITLLNAASSIYTSAVSLVLADSRVPVARLEASVESAKSAIQHIASFKQVLDLASALVLLAGAISSGNAASIPAGIVALEDAAEAIIRSRDAV